jgi:adenosylmethionine-8-amino-7-oxononanoate aminotransferase
MVGIELVKDRATKEPYPLDKRTGHWVAMEARRLGLLLRPLGNVLVLMPPLSLSPKDLASMVARVQAAIRTVTEQQPSGRGSGRRP